MRHRWTFLTDQCKRLGSGAESANKRFMATERERKGLELYTLSVHWSFWMSLSAISGITWKICYGQAGPVTILEQRLKQMDINYQTPTFRILVNTSIHHKF
jgi:hypothetical protein